MKNLLNSRMIISILILLVILHITFSEKISEETFNMLDTPVVKIGFIIVITYIAKYNMMAAIVMAFGYLLTIQQVSYKQTFKNVKLEHFKNDDELDSDVSDDEEDEMHHMHKITMPDINDKTERMKQYNIIKCKKLKELANEIKGDESVGLLNKAYLKEIKANTLDNMQKNMVALEKAKNDDNMNMIKLHNDEAEFYKNKINSINRLSKLVKKLNTVDNPEKYRKINRDITKQRLKIYILADIEEAKQIADKLIQDGIFDKANENKKEINMNMEKLNSIIISEKLDKQLEENIYKNQPIDESKIENDLVIHKLIAESLVNIEEHKKLAEAAAEDSDIINMKNHLAQVNTEHSIVDAYTKSSLYYNASVEAKELGAIEESEKLLTKSNENLMKGDILVKMEQLDKVISEAKNNNMNDKANTIQEEKERERKKLITLIQKEEHDTIAEETSDMNEKKDNLIKSALQELKLNLLSKSD
jgi:hypothetical protein